MTDSDTIESLKRICRFRYALEDGRCVSLSFHDENEVFGGTIRKHPGKHEIIERVARLPHLRHFDVRKCKLGRLPEMASRDLEYVDVSCNDLSSVPDWIPKQPRLRFLNLGANRIREVPDLSHLPLEVLKLHKNALTRMPETGTGIKSLNLYFNRLDRVPPQVLALRELEVFSLGVTEVRTLPSLSALPNLRWLTLTVNPIEILPEDICSLKKLEGLQLAKNRLKRLPERMGEMSLRALTVYGNDLSRLPESFFGLKLRKLNVARNPLCPRQKKRVWETFGAIDFLSV